jgi:uncharacterized protein (DUF302 family)
MGDAMIVTRSASGQAETLAALLAAIARHGLTLVARIDHAAAARGAGMELPDEEVVIFGNPRAGTPLMADDPQIGIELPLRMLVWSDAEGTAIGYRDPRGLAALYRVTPHRATLDQMAALLRALADEAAA